MALLSSDQPTKPAPLKATLTLLTPLEVPILRQHFAGAGPFQMTLNTDTLEYAGRYKFVVTSEGKQEITCFTLLSDSSLQPNYDLNYLVRVSNPSNSKIHNFRLFLAIPKDNPPFQRVTKLHFIKGTGRLADDLEGNTWVQYEVPLLSSKTSKEFGYLANLALTGVQYALPPDNTPLPDIALLKYTKPEQHVESDHPLIIALAQQIKFKNAPEIATKAFEMVKQKVHYAIQAKEFGAAYAIEKGYGDCTEFSSLFVALCRACGLPSRLQSGFSKTSRGNWERHAWAEFYHRGLWIQVDPTSQVHSDLFTYTPNKILMTTGNWMKTAVLQEFLCRYRCEDPSAPLEIDVRYQIIPTPKKKPPQILAPETSKPRIIKPKKNHDPQSSIHGLHIIDFEFLDIAKRGTNFPARVILHNNSKHLFSGIFLLWLENQHLCIQYSEPIQLPPNTTRTIEYPLTMSHCFRKLTVVSALLDNNGKLVCTQRKKIYLY